MIYVVSSEMGLELHQGESFPAAKILADNHKRDTGRNASIESRTQVYTTTTLDEVMEARERTQRAVAEAHDAMKRGDPLPSVRVGDHPPEPRERPATDPDGPEPRARSHKSLTY